MNKPVPNANKWSKYFWQAARSERLMIQHCLDCGNFIFYPRSGCPHCNSERLEWTESSGRGKVYSYTVVQNNAPSAFLADMPFVIAIVRLEEGVQMLSNIVGCDPSEVYCEMPVVVTFEQLNDEITLPKFKPRVSKEDKDAAEILG